MDLKKELQKEFKRRFGNIDIISTVDHPYPSIPLRILSSHKILYRYYLEGKKVLILNIDNIALEKRKHDISVGVQNMLVNFGYNKDVSFFDGWNGIYATKSLNKNIDFNKLKEIFKKRLDILNFDKFNIKRNKINRFLLYNSFSELLEIYKMNLNKSKNATEFYKNNLLSFYNFFNLDKDFVYFVKNNLKSVYYDFTDYVIYFLNKTKDTEYDFRVLYNFEDKIVKPFRYLNGREVERSINYDDLIEKVKNREVIFGSSMLLWIISVLEKKHFGNDRGFLNLVLGESAYNNFQLTKYNKDYVKFWNVLKVNFFNYNSGKLILNKSYNEEITIPVLFLHYFDNNIDFNKEIKIEIGKYYDFNNIKIQYNDFWDKAYKIRHFTSLNSDVSLRKENNFLKEIIKNKYLNNHIKIIDYAGGSGRHSLELSKDKKNIVYVYDWDEDGIKSILRKKLNNLHAKNINLINFNLKNKFDVGICMYSSVGYFNDHNNLLVLLNFLLSIKKGGIIILDLMNPDWVIKNSQNFKIDKRIDYLDGNTYHILHKRNVRFRPYIVEDNYLSFDKNINGKKEFYYFLRVYPVNFLKNFLNYFNFNIVNIYGDFDFNKINDNRQRLIVIAKKNI